MASRIGGASGFGTAQQDRQWERLPTQEQLAALAKFFKVPMCPREARRIVDFSLGLTAILHEDTSEYRAKKPSTAVGKAARSVNKRRKSSTTFPSRRLPFRAL
jgi:hypothetical protein